MPPKKYYVVWKGRKTGIFSSWDSCSVQVKGFPGAEFKSFSSRKDAEKAFRENYEDYKGKHTSTLSPQQLARIGSPIQASYCVDAACSGNPGPMEYRCVHTSSRKQLFHKGPYQQGTSNVGEFLALTHVLALFDSKNIKLPVYSDSVNAIKWVKTKKCKTRLKQTAANTEIFDLIIRAETWLQENDFQTRIMKWETAAWGEIPADFGRK